MCALGCWRRVIRMVFVNPDLTSEDVDRAFEVILGAGEELPASDNAIAECAAVV